MLQLEYEVAMCSGKFVSHLQKRAIGSVTSYNLSLILEHCVILKLYL